MTNGQGLGQVTVQVPIPIPPGNPGNGNFYDGSDRSHVKSYRKLQNTYADVANFNVETTESLAIFGHNAELWTINSHDSTLLRFDPAFTSPTDRYPTLMNPVAVALHEDDPIVLGGTTSALVKHDRLDGSIKLLVDLPARPFHMVVDEDTEEVWVSCWGGDQVVCVDMLSGEISRTVSGVGKHPGFLELVVEPASDQTPNGPTTWVYVTPFHSGNNSIVFDFNLAGTFIADGEDPQFFPERGLPDNDLFKIEASTGAVSAVAFDVNTLITAHRYNPVTDQTLVAGIELLNKDPNLFGEPAARGRFAVNRIALVDEGPERVLPTSFTVLDVNDPLGPDGGGGQNPDTASFPWGIEINPVTGWAWITSSTNDLVCVLDENGARRPAFDMALPPGSIPRSVRLDATGTLLLVDCWGTNEIRVFNAATSQFLVTYFKGNDPTLEAVKAGRELWYDATRNQDHKVSCNTCHPGGGADAEEWQIAETDVDEKDVMVTQPLRGIVNTPPHHWRGERQLEDFNVSHTALLGAAAPLSEAPGGELDRFDAFVHSLRTFANPNQHVSRMIVDRQTPWAQPNGMIGRATEGDVVFHDVPSVNVNGVNSFSCEECHKLPTGGNGFFVAEEPSRIPARINLEVTQLDNQLHLKDQPIFDVKVMVGPNPEDFVFVPRLETSGAGTTHSGGIVSLFDFVNIFPLEDQQKADCTAFLEQFDTGTSAAAHHAVLLAFDTPGEHLRTLRQEMFPQTAPERWGIDVVVHGTVTLAGQVRTVSWLYEPGTKRFVPDDPALSVQSLRFFLDQARADEGSNLFLGVAPGSGRQMSIDRDNDGVRNGQETLDGTDPFSADTDGDGWKDGYEKDHGSDALDAQSTPVDTTAPDVMGNVRLLSKVATSFRFYCETNEECRIEIDYSTPGGDAYTFREEDFTRHHTMVLPHREPSNPNFQTNAFNFSLRLIDRAGNERILGLGTEDSGEFPTFDNSGIPQFMIVNEIRFLNEAAAVGSGTFSADVEVTVEFAETLPNFTPAQDRVVLVQINTRAPGSDWSTDLTTTSSHPTSFVFDDDGVELYSDLDGPILVCPLTDAGGVTTADFQVTGLAPGTEVMANVVGILVPDDLGTYDPANPVFPESLPVFYLLPHTAPEDRNVVTTF